MGFKGEVFSVGELLRRAAGPAVPIAVGVGVRHTAAESAARVAELLAAGESLVTVWRFGILQTLDDYTSTLRRGGPETAAGMFVDKPPLTGSAELDAAYAALADYLAEREGLTPPAWVSDPTRTVQGAAWFASTPELFRGEAVRESPRAFRSRGIMITARALERA